MGRAACHPAPGRPNSSSLEGLGIDDDDLTPHLLIIVGHPDGSPDRPRVGRSRRHRVHAAAPGRRNPMRPSAVKQIMRYRIDDWDVAMPASLAAYWTAWNEKDLGVVRRHLVSAVEDDVEWNDPRDSFIGLTELETAIRRLRSSKPGYRFVIASEIDHHNDRYRYRWDMLRGDRVLMEGLDIVTISPQSGLIARVDGFFGQPTPIRQAGSGIPPALRADGADPHDA